MSAIVLPQGWAQQPRAFTPLSQRNPAWRGLAFAVNGALGPYDFVAKKRATTWNESKVMSVRGVGLAGTGGAAKVAEWDYNPIIGSNANGSGDVSFVALANPISEARGSVLIGIMRNGSPFSQISLMANLDGNAGTASAGMLTIQSYSGANQGYANAASVVDGGFHVFVGVYRPSVGMTLYVDGIDKTTASNATGGNFGNDASSRISVGSESYSTTRTANAVIPFAGGFNRALSPVEARIITANVWAAWAAQNRVITFPDAAPPPAGGFGMVKVGGSWKTISGMQVKVGGVWKTVASAKVKVGGSWKSLT